MPSWGVTDERAQRRIANMKLAFPDAVILSPSSIAVIPEKVHPKDRHVVATAVVGKAQVVVTNNVRHFAKAELERDLASWSRLATTSSPINGRSIAAKLPPQSPDRSTHSAIPLVTWTSTPPRSRPTA